MRELDHRLRRADIKSFFSLQRVSQNDGDKLLAFSGGRGPAACFSVMNLGVLSLFLRSKSGWRRKLISMREKRREKDVEGSIVSEQLLGRLSMPLRVDEE